MLQGFVLLAQASKGCAVFLIASGLPRANLSVPKPQIKKRHYSTLPNSLFCLGWGGCLFSGGGGGGVCLGLGFFLGEFWDFWDVLGFLFVWGFFCFVFIMLSPSPLFLTPDFLHSLCH